MRKKRVLAYIISLSMAFQSMTGIAYAAETEMPEVLTESEAVIADDAEFETVTETEEEMLLQSEEAVIGDIASEETIIDESAEDMSEESAVVMEETESIAAEEEDAVTAADWSINAEVEKYAVTALNAAAKTYSSRVTFDKVNRYESVSYYIVYAEKKAEDDVFAAIEAEKDVVSYSEISAVGYKRDVVSNYSLSAPTYYYDFNNLKADTEYSYRIMVYADDRRDMGTFYYFVTAPMSFRTRPVVAETQVKAVAVETLQGAYYTTYSFKIENPLDEEIKYVGYTIGAGTTPSDLKEIKEDGVYSFLVPNANTAQDIYPYIALDRGTQAAPQTVPIVKSEYTQKVAARRTDIVPQLTAEVKSPVSVEVSLLLPNLTELDLDQLRQKGSSAWINARLKGKSTIMNSVGLSFDSGNEKMTDEGILLTGTLNSLNANTEYDININASTTTFGFAISALATPISVKTDASVDVDETMIPDKAFLNKLLESWDYNNDGKLTTEELAKVTRLVLDTRNAVDENSKPVESLEGIQYMPALESVSLYADAGCTLSGTEGFEKLYKLNSLVMTGYSVSSLNGIAAASKLEKVSFSKAKELSLEGIDKLSSLETLNINQCEKVDYIDLDKQESVQTIVIGDSGDISLNCLPASGNLASLTISNVNVADASAIEGVTSLNELHLNNCGLTAISGVDKLVKLTELSLDNNMLKTIDEVKNLTELELLSVENNNLTDIPDISGLTKLMGGSALNLDKNYLTAEKLTIDKLPMAFDKEWIEETLQTQKSYKADTKVAVKSISIAKNNIGFTGCTVEIVYSNPESEEVVYYLEDENGKKVTSVNNDYYGYGDVKRNIRLAAGAANRVRLVLETIKGYGEEVKLYSEYVEVPAKDSNEFKPTAAASAIGNMIMLEALQSPFYSVDDDRIYVHFSIKKDSVIIDDTISLMSLYGKNDARAAVNFENDILENTEYDYTVSFYIIDEKGNKKTFGEEINGKVQTGTIENYSDDIFKDTVLRKEIKRLVSDRSFTNVNLAKITSLNISVYRYSDPIVSNLSGMEKLVNLENAEFINNDIAELPDLSGLKRLRTFNLDNNIIPAGEFKEEKLPEGLKTYYAESNNGISWIDYYRHHQRKEMEYVVSPKYYAYSIDEEGKFLYPFVLGVKNVRFTSDRYVLEISIDGKEYSSNNLYLSRESDKCALAAIEGIAVDTAESAEKEVNYSLYLISGYGVGAEKVEIASASEKVSFVDEVKNNNVKYFGKTSTTLYSYKIYLPLISAVTEENAADAEVYLYRDTEKLGRASTVRISNDYYDDRYTASFGTGYSPSDGKLRYLTGDIKLAKYATEGYYDAKVILKDYEFTAEKIAYCTAGDRAVVTGVSKYSDIFDQSKEHVYVKVSGYAFNPDNVHPEFTDNNGEAALEYIGVAGNINSSYEDDSRVLKYKKIGAQWPIGDVTLKYTMKAADGYDVLVADEVKSGTLSFSTYANIQNLHYNYREKSAEIFVNEYLGVGRKVKVELFDRASNLNGQAADITGEAEVDKNGLIRFVMKDSAGEIFVPVYKTDADRRFDVNIYDALTDELLTSARNQQLKWINYAEKYHTPESVDDVVRDHIESLIERVDAPEITVRGNLKYNAGKKVTAILYSALESASAEGYINADGVLEDANGNAGVKIALNGKFTTGYSYIQLQDEEGNPLKCAADTEDSVASEVILYDNNYFYAYNQRGNVSIDGTANITIASEQIYGEAKRANESRETLFTETGILNPANYKLRFTDALGNVVNSEVVPESVTHASYLDDEITLVCKGIDTSYTGYYVHVSYCDKEPVCLGEEPLSYYASNAEWDNNCHKTYGKWITVNQESHGGSFYTDDYVRCGIYGAYVYNKADLPAAAEIYEPGTDVLLKTIKLNCDENSTSYRFTAEDVQGLDGILCQAVLKISNGRAVSRQLGYVVSYDSKYKNEYADDPEEPKNPEETQNPENPSNPGDNSGSGSGSGNENGGGSGSGNENGGGAGTGTGAGSSADDNITLPEGATITNGVINFSDGSMADKKSYLAQEFGLLTVYDTVAANYNIADKAVYVDVSKTVTPANGLQVTVNAGAKVKFVKGNTPLAVKIVADPLGKVNKKGVLKPKAVSLNAKKGIITTKKVKNQAKTSVTVEYAESNGTTNTVVLNIINVVVPKSITLSTVADDAAAKIELKDINGANVNMLNAVWSLVDKKGAVRTKKTVYKTSGTSYELTVGKLTKGSVKAVCTINGKKYTTTLKLKNK